MHNKFRKLPAGLLSLFLMAGASWAMTAESVNIIPGQSAVVDDDEVPEVTDRVARISFVEGEAKIRRNGSEDWEKLTLNLPLVEGDEISTESGARIEMQFDKNRHLRLDEDSFLKLTTLKEEGIAVSLSLGGLSLRVTSFDKERSFFEIDAPKTTLAIQKAGRYRVDAGKQGDNEVRASVSEGGEARIYSDTAGFTLKNDRSTRIYTDGPNAGEWDTGEASRYDNDFSEWSKNREDLVARRLKDAYYDKYYDDDIYGADDLNDNGDWVNTTDYGYVWRPNRLATAQFSNWSPYRYGHWRWMQPYGWIWVNDEPWGWATYHHGRWFSYNGGWVWSPYGYYRARRSWWSPAFVVINIFNNNVCWYPMPYRHRRNNNWNNNPPPQRDTKVSLRNPRSTPPVRITTKDRIDVPPTGVVTTTKEDFGKRSMRVKTADEAIARTVFTKTSDDVPDPVLPDYKGRRKSLDIVTDKPNIDPVIQTRVGAAPRKSDRPMDEDLKTTRIFGGRPPQKTTDSEVPTREPMTRPNEPRKTGAVDRSSSSEQTERANPIRRVPTPREPVYTPPPPRETPKYDPPKQSERTRSDPPPTKQPERSSPPPKSEPKPADKPAEKPADKPAPPSRKDKPDSQ